MIDKAKIMLVKGQGSKKQILFMGKNKKATILCR